MFSEMVDRVINRSKRPDRLADIVNWANLTMRECQTRALFYKDLIEDEITVPQPTADPFIWNRPTGVRLLKAVKYPDGSYPNFLKPGPVQKHQRQYFYAASTYYVFVGVSNSIDSSITDPVVGIAYYQYLRRLGYYAVADRPAVYDESAQTWTYNPPTTDPDVQEADQALVANWLLLDHGALIEEGTLAKVFKDAGDSQRAVSTYSLYKQLQETDLLANETLEILPSGAVDTQ